MPLEVSHRSIDLSVDDVRNVRESATHAEVLARSVLALLNGGKSDPVPIRIIGAVDGEAFTVKNRLNELMKKAAYASRKSASLVEVDSKVPPFTVTPAEMRYRLLQQSEAVSNEGLQISPEAWKEHCIHSRNFLRDHRNTEGKLSPDRIERLLRGMCAELVTQRMLAEASQVNTDHPDLKLMERGQTVRPIPQEHWFRFTGKHNCELHAKVGGRRLTEFDAMALSGLHPDMPHSHSRLFAIDSTTTEDSFQSRCVKKMTQIEDFVHEMDRLGVEVHIFHVLFREKDGSNKIAPIRQSLEQERSHVIPVPLLQTINPLVERTAKDLGENIKWPALSLRKTPSRGGRHDFDIF